MLPSGGRRVVGRRGEIRLLSGRSWVIPEDEGRIPRAGDARPPGLGYGQPVATWASISERVRGAGADRLLALTGAAVAIASLVAVAVQGPDMDAPVASALVGVVSGACVAESRRRPVAAILAFSVALTLAVVLGSEIDVQNGSLIVPFFLLPVTWSANIDHRTFVRTAPLVLLLLPMADVIRDPSDAADFLTFVLLIPIGLGTTAGRLMRWHAEAADRLAAQARELEANREARAAAAVTAERARIARDLHDLIAHDVSVMVVQAQGAERLTARDPAAAEDAIAQIERTGRDALFETRRLLGVLRREDEDLALRPQPSMRRILAVMDEARARGVEARLDCEGAVDDLPPGIDMGAYRILSDALRSVVEHGGARHATATVRRSSAALELRLEADGPISPTILAGIHERVLLFGGELDVQKHAEGTGGVLGITLPLESAVAA